MTTAAMIFGMLPLALALDEGGEIQAPMGRAIIGGVITSGQGTDTITFQSGGPGTTMELQATDSILGCDSPTSSTPISVDFLDVPAGAPFHDAINTVARNKVTVGCGQGDYCPDSINTRAQMAVFLLKSKLGSDHVPPAATGTVFGDVGKDDFAAAWIEELHSLGITTGCNGGNDYCPDASVSRAEMAVFLLKTLLGSDYAPPAATGLVFGDVATDTFAAKWIEDLHTRGITAGCNTAPPLPLYCPDASNTRAEMAPFLTKTFGLH